MEKEIRSKKEKKEEAKLRIFKAAVSLFARKGFDAVGIREVARAARVNISMINYYYGGKLGILKTIIEQMSARYDESIREVLGENLTPEEQVHEIVHRLIKFFRKNTEIAIVSFNTFQVDRPEIVDARLKWVAGRRTFLNQLYTQLGLNTADAEAMSVIRGLLTTVIFNDFRSEYIWQFTKQAYKKSKYLSGDLREEAELEPTEAYWTRYGHILTTVYLQGICGLARALKDKKEQPCIT